MTNKPKAVGTAAETGLVNYLRANGFPNARRVALAGANDCGDVYTGTGIIFEVKAGDQADNPSMNQIRDWVRETERERVNAGAQLGFLVLKRKGVGPARAGEWRAWWTEKCRRCQGLTVIRGAELADVIHEIGDDA